MFSGYIDDVRHSKKKLAFAGYSTSILYKLALLLATSWVGILAARVIDRTGKGIRTAPRDALVAQSSESKKLGGSFGLHKMLDMAGSSMGAFLAYLFIQTNFGFNEAFIYSIVPAAIGILLILAVKEANPNEPHIEKLNLKGLKPDKKLRVYLGVIFLFCIGNSSNVFLLLKAQETGLTSSQVMLLYLLFNLSAAALAIPAGNLSDKYWRSGVLVPGYLIYGIVYFGFAFMHSKPATVILFIAYEAYTAFISGAERAFIIENSPAEFQGTMLGIYGMLQGIGLLLASIIAGMMWNGFGSDAPFVFGGILGTVSSALIAFILGDKNKRKYSQQYE